MDPSSCHCPTRRVVRGWARNRCVARLCAIGLVAALALPVRAQVASATAEQVKAAYLYKFLSYIDWPPSAAPPPGAPYVIGVEGADAVYDELSHLAANRPVQGHPVQVRRVANASDKTVPMHLVFVGRALASPLARVLSAWTSEPVVTVTDQPAALGAGAVLNFVEDDGRVRFEADTAAAERVGVRLSARLLAVASRVQGASR